MSTFWDVFFVLLIWVPLITLWICAMADIVGRRDLGGGSKALWIVCVLLVPWLGALVYLVVRPRGVTQPV